MVKERSQKATCVLILSTYLRKIRKLTECTQVKKKKKFVLKSIRKREEMVTACKPESVNLEKHPLKENRLKEKKNCWKLKEYISTS